MIDLFQPGTLLRCPGGNVENVSAQKAAGVTWALLNIGRDPCVQMNPAVWDHQRSLYRSIGMPHGPWMHVHSMADLEFLIQTGIAWNAPLIGPNLEDVVSDKLSLQEVGGYLLDFWVNPRSPYFGFVHLPTLPWVQNDQGWEHVAFATFALEMFPEEGNGQAYLDEYQRCIDHAFKEGAGKVTLLYSVKSPRSVYPNVAHCTYTADNVTNWGEWKDTVPQVIPKPPAPVPPTPEAPMQTATQFPYTGPLYGPSHPDGPTLNRATIKGLKRAMIRLRYLQQQLGHETDDFGPDLEDAFKAWWKEEGGVGRWTGYGRGSWLALRATKVTSGPNRGTYAMDALALSYVRADALIRCYPHPLGSMSQIGQGLHATAGLYGNWAIDFLAPGGTKVLAVEDAEITRLSGHDPADGAQQNIGIFGWSVTYETPQNYIYFSTHYGARAGLRVGQPVQCGQVLGTVGSWPGDPARSHTHLGVTSPRGIADAKARILDISQAKRVSA